MLFKLDKDFVQPSTGLISSSKHHGPIALELLLHGRPWDAVDHSLAWG